MPISTLHSIVSLTVSLAPVVVFLIVLIAIDSYKLTPFRSVLVAIFVGSIAAFACLWINSAIMGAVITNPTVFARYVAPAVEELLKGSLLVVLIRRAPEAPRPRVDDHVLSDSVHAAHVRHPVLPNAHGDPSIPRRRGALSTAPIRST